VATVPVLVFTDEPAPKSRAARTLRALRLAGLDGLDLSDAPGALPAGPVWLIRAGAWPTCAAPPAFPPSSSTGLPLAALGATRSPPDGADLPEAAAWAALIQRTGGDLSGAPGATIPPVASAYLEAPLAAAVAARLAAGCRPSQAIALALEGARAIRFAPLDVHDDPGLRVAEIVTSVQQGGAERVAVDLARALPSRGIATKLCALWRPTRASLPVPEGTLDLSGFRGSREARLDALADALVRWGADLAHAHLLARSDLAALAARGLPPMVTVHNLRPGFPPDLERLTGAEAVLLVACARAVEADLAAAGLPLPLRTAWNGVDFAACARTKGRLAEARALRKRLDLAPDDLVLLSVANPRPQKRLHLLPAILAAARAALPRLGIDRRVRLVLAGDTTPASEGGKEAAEALRREIARTGMAPHLRLAGSVGAIAPLLAAADVLVSPSAYEGLSLAHLEALAAGLPVVATGEGGTLELARATPGVTLLPLDADPGAFAEAIAAALHAPPAGAREAAARHFTTARMAESHARLIPRAVERANRAPSPPLRKGDGLVLVTNNFSTGGAQSSARRLLLGLAAGGVRVRAAVLEEQAPYPTVGRRALTSARIPVLCLPPAGTLDPAESVARLLAFIDAEPPRAVVLWNVIAEHKILLADGLLDVPLLDVSPGEMYFVSLARYFASPRPGLPYQDPRTYGARLAGVIVKHRGEADQAAEVLGAPVHVVENGVALGEPRETAARSTLVLGTAARIHPHKKLDELLRALRLAAPRLPAYELRIAGGVEAGCDAHMEDLRRLAEGLPVTWLGEIEDTRPFLRELDVFALIAEPSGCPNASLEALAEGLPVVATRVGGMSEQIEDGVSGRLVPPADPVALAAALVEVCADPALRARLGRAGRERVEARFSVARMVSDYRRICLS
jgi:glycosyltransferase involved in cell wall biosynthesis